MTITEQELKDIIRESIEEVMGQNQAAGIMPEKMKRVAALNKQLWAIKKEADALQLENASKWIYMAIQSIDREYISDTVSNGFNRAKETVQGWFKEE